MNDNSLVHVTDKSWDSEVLKSELPVFVDFWAEWCGPCRMVGPAIEQLAQTMTGKVKFAKLNVDENREIAAKYGIQSIPSLILFRQGNEVARTIGSCSERNIPKVHRTVSCKVKFRQNAKGIMNIKSTFSGNGLQRH